MAPLNRSCQTKPGEIVFCYGCEYTAGDYHELGEHMVQHHFEGNCKICGEMFTKQISHITY